MCVNENSLLHLFAAISLYGDQKAFEQLFRSQHHRLYRFARQFTGQHQSAEEVVNDVFVKLWRYRNHLQTVKNPESYLFIAVKNQSLNYIKQYSQVYVPADKEQGLMAMPADAAPDFNLEWKELRQRMHDVVDNLPDQCRKIFRLVREEGMKPADVARLLQLSVRTVETQLYRATKRLDEVLQSRQNRGMRKGRSNTSGLAILLLLTLLG